MHKIVNSIRIVILPALFLMAIEPAEAQQVLQELHWLEGVWSRLPEKSEIRLEIWQKAPDGSLLGRGCIVQGTDTLVTERLKIIQSRQNTVFVAEARHYSSPVYFVLSRKGGGIWVFENPGHPYPNLISYRRKGPDQMACTSEGSGRKVLVYYQRIGIK